MLWKLPQVLFRPVTKRYVEEQVLHKTSIQHLFNIIQDVDQYSTFLPLCTYSKVIPSSHKRLTDGRHYLEATLTVGVPPFVQETYDSAVYINPHQYTIETQSIKSHHFDSLKSYWKLTSGSDDNNNNNHNFDLGGQTTNVVENINPNVYNNNNSIHNQQQSLQRISSEEPITNVYFMVEMTVSDPMISTTLDQLLEQVAKQQVAAFAQRCLSIPTTTTTTAPK